MLSYYLDTSALVKRYHAEAGTFGPTEVSSPVPAEHPCPSTGTQDPSGALRDDRTHVFPRQVAVYRFSLRLPLGGLYAAARRGPERKQNPDPARRLLRGERT